MHSRQYGPAAAAGTPPDFASPPLRGGACGTSRVRTRRRSISDHAHAHNRCLNGPAPRWGMRAPARFRGRTRSQRHQTRRSRGGKQVHFPAPCSCRWRAIWRRFVAAVLRGGRAVSRRARRCCKFPLCNSCERFLHRVPRRFDAGTQFVIIVLLCKRCAESGTTVLARERSGRQRAESARLRNKAGAQVLACVKCSRFIKAKTIS